MKLIPIIVQLLVVASLSVPSLASAQSAEGQAPVELRIGTPDPGQVVQIPFTVQGVATPGARLELWIGEKLERVFMADSSGNFNVPVSRAGSGAVTVHLVDAAGERLRTTSVDVVWGGAAANAAVVEPNAEGAGQGEPIDVFSEDPTAQVTAEIPPKKSEPLPKVSDLDAAYAKGEALPMPERATPARVSPDQQVVAEGAPIPRRPNQVSRGVRGLAEAGLGVGSALVGGFGLGALGFVVGIATTDGFGALGVMVLGGVTGLAVGLPIGVYYGGKLLDGNGKWWAPVVGEAIGLLAGTALAVALPYELDGLAVFSVFALPTLGAVIGYELTSDKSAWEAKHGVSVTPTIAPTREGGVSLGLQLRF